MAQMIHHADAIVRDAPKVPEFNEYPKMMAHPAYRPGEVGTEVKSPGGYSHHVGGTPIRFPPVLVHGADDEEYHAAKGYVSQGKSDAAAFQRLAAAAVPKTNDYQPVEFPKWAGGVLVNNREEEAAALAARREQLNIKIEPAEDVPAKHYQPPEDAPFSPPVKNDETSQRFDAIERSLAEMREMMGQFVLSQSQKAAEPVVSETIAATIEPIELPKQQSISKQQKAADTRKRNALAKQQAAD